MRLKAPNEAEDPGLINPDNIPSELVRHRVDRDIHRGELRKKYGSLAYLKNLMKVCLKDNISCFYCQLFIQTNKYRKRLNNGPPFLHACTLFVYEIHA